MSIHTLLCIDIKLIDNIKILSKLIWRVTQILKNNLLDKVKTNLIKIKLVLLLVLLFKLLIDNNTQYWYFLFDILTTYIRYISVKSEWNIELIFHHGIIFLKMIISNNNNIYHTNKIKILIDILEKYQYLIFLFDIFIIIIKILT